MDPEERQAKSFLNFVAATSLFFGLKYGIRYAYRKFKGTKKQKLKKAKKLKLI
jgi:hypothetical protein